MAYDFFFTLPSQLGRRLSMIDPLGFRGAASHYLQRLAPGFTGRVRGRTWFPILCWAAKIVEDDEVQGRTASAEDPRTRVRARRAAIGSLERAMRVGAMLSATIEDAPYWRYGNRPQWFERHRRQQLGTKYASPEPPFFASRASELANNALGCLRRSLERHALMTPSEGRLSGTHTQIIPTDRYRLTDRGRLLADAYEADLKRNKITLGTLKDWGLFPDRLGRRFNNDSNREAAARRIAEAIPVTNTGAFDSDRFASSATIMDTLFQVDADPLFFGHRSSGPLPAVVRAFSEHPETHPLDALASTTVTGDFWDQRRGAAAHAASVLMGRPTPERPALFEILGSCFVEGMRAAFPNQQLDAPRFTEQFGKFAPPGMARQYERGRSDYLTALERLAILEQQPENGYSPRVEQLPGSGVSHFDGWIKQTTRLDLGALLELHETLPRFGGGRVLPLVERDAGAAYLEGPFAWGAVACPMGDELAENESDISDTQDALASADQVDAEAEETEETAGRMLITDYWWAAKIAGDVILGRPR
ncbi:hypothetical protein DB30_05666 [Enhygromyxa salina]|uniref:Uncharacterized protein n=1 Tax=Enhygromyxa salina TaxID=215803 RepID=A0A0C1ZCC1_9BACT|nr:hypothetical protein [Enhygromyxa salina]KIG15334.1 hypothetical protein DB30_05666 [Enhygromyxa salina]